MKTTPWILGGAVAAAIAFSPLRGSTSDCSPPSRIKERLIAATGTSTAVEMCIVAFSPPGAYIVPCDATGAFEDEEFLVTP